jgi:hypothetical protein
VVLVHFAAEHATEFQFLQQLAQTLDLSGNVIDGALVFFFGGHLQQILGVGKAGRHVVEGVDDLRQLRAFAAKVLSVLGVVPDSRIFELAVYFGQTIMFVIVVKDTPEWFRSARTGP